MRKYILPLIFILCLTFTLIGNCAWLTDWTYRKEIVIAHTDDGAQTDYQMKLLVGESSGAIGEEVDCEGNVADDFDDLRFTTDDGETLCDYWIESITGGTPNQLATVWIEVPSIAAHPDDTTIYMYYSGTETAVGLDLAAGKATFELFDDFNDGTTLDPQWGTTAGTPAVAGGILTLNSAGEWVKSTFDRQYGGLRINAKFPALTGATHLQRFMFGITYTDNDPSCTIYAMDVPDEASSALTGDADSYNNQLYTWARNTYEIFDINWCSTSVKYYEEGLLRVTEANSDHIYQAGSLNVILATQLGTEALLVNWVLVRNYTANEPTWDSFGSEEEEPPEGITWNGITITKWNGITITIPINTQ